LLLLERSKLKNSFLFKISTSVCFAESNILEIEQNDVLEQDMSYPTGLFKWLMKFPLSLYRIGLGWLLASASIIILTTRGHRSGVPRFTALECRRHGSKFYLVAAWGERSHWYQNLRAYPLATIKHGHLTYTVSASFVEDRSESLRVVSLFRQVAPAFYDQLLTRFSSFDRVDFHTLPAIAREVKIVRLDILNQPAVLPAISADLAWVLPTFAGVFFMSGVVMRFVLGSHQDDHE
jgi:deazaflavin-dependent oxidoreductase (nitroreductase family)